MAASPQPAAYAQGIYSSPFSSITYLTFQNPAPFICGRIQSKKQLPQAAGQKGAGNLCWVRRVGRLKGDGILLCPSRKTLSPPDTQQKLSLPWRLAGNGLPVSQSCSRVTRRASCKSSCPKCKPCRQPLLHTQPHPWGSAVRSRRPGFLGWHSSLRQPWLLARCGGTLSN